MFASCDVRFAARSLTTTIVWRGSVRCDLVDLVSVSVRQSRSARPSRTTAITGGSPRRSGSASSSSTAHAALGSSASGSAPPPTRATVSSTSPPTSSASRVARARTPRGARAACAAPGPRSASRARARAAGSLERGERQLVRAESALERVARSCATSSARPTTMPACGPPRSLSPEKQTRSAPARRLSAGVGSSPTCGARPSRGRPPAGGPIALRFGQMPSRGRSVNPTTLKFD